jgi:hypothetical protein
MAVPDKHIIDKMIKCVKINIDISIFRKIYNL